MSKLQSLSTRHNPNLPSFVSTGAQRSATTQSTVKTRFLLLSDTHAHSELVGPWPKADVLLHAGDLSGNGGVAQLRFTFDMLKKADAPVKIVIAGNHDMTLDEYYWTNHPHNSKQLVEATKEAEDAWKLWTSDEAKNAGIVYLEEGTHTISLTNGAKFTIYTSPFTPEFCQMGFAYARGRDRFNLEADSPSPPSLIKKPTAGATPTEIVEEKFVPPEPVESWPAIDIMMTHGPPRHHLDAVWRKYAGEIYSEPVGCINQLAASYRARPRLSVFGHIHESRGAELVRWQEEGCPPLASRAAAGQAAGVGGGSSSGDRAEADLSPDSEPPEKAGGGVWKAGHGTESIEGEPVGAKEGETEFVHIDASSGGPKPLRWGEETLMVNAAMLTRRGQATRAPWVVDLDLHCA